MAKRSYFMPELVIIGTDGERQLIGLLFRGLIHERIGGWAIVNHSLGLHRRRFPLTR